MAVANDDGAKSGGGQSPESALEQIQAPVHGEAILPGSHRKTWLFTYDTLMNPAVLTRFVKGIVPGKVVQLPSFRLVWPFNYPPQGTALPSIERHDGTGEGPGVWGVIYDVTKKDLTQLERYLHVPNRYHQRALNVIDRGDFRLPAVTYVLSVSGGSPLVPSATYREELLAGARTYDLPPDWLGYLEGLTTAD
jgi:hypothetical protein